MYSGVYTYIRVWKYIYIYGRAGHIYRPRPSAGSVISGSTDALIFFLFISPRFPIYIYIYICNNIVKLCNNGSKIISVTSWSRTTAITITIHMYRSDSWCELHDVLLTGPMTHGTTAIPNPDVMVTGLKDAIIYYETK